MLEIKNGIAIKIKIILPMHYFYIAHGFLFWIITSSYCCELPSSIFSFQTEGLIFTISYRSGSIQIKSALLLPVQGDRNVGNGK